MAGKSGRLQAKEANLTSSTLKVLDRQRPTTRVDQELQSQLELQIQLGGSKAAQPHGQAPPFGPGTGTPNLQGFCEAEMRESRRCIKRRYANKPSRMLGEAHEAGRAAGSRLVQARQAAFGYIGWGLASSTRTYQSCHTRVRFADRVLKVVDGKAANPQGPCNSITAVHLLPMTSLSSGSKGFFLCSGSRQFSNTKFRVSIRQRPTVRQHHSEPMIMIRYSV